MQKGAARDKGDGALRGRPGQDEALTNTCSTGQSGHRTWTQLTQAGVVRTVMPVMAHMCWSGGGGCQGLAVTLGSLLLQVIDLGTHAGPQPDLDRLRLFHLVLVGLNEDRTGRVSHASGRRAHWTDGCCEDVDIPWRRRRPRDAAVGCDVQ